MDVLAPLADVVIDRDAAPRTIELGSAFDLRDVTGTVVRFSTNAPLDDKDVFAKLFDQPGEGRTRTAPLTVANFLAHADAGRSTNTTVHRSVPGFVVQGGGFRLTSSGSEFVEAIAQFPAVLNEPGNPNAIAQENLVTLTSVPRVGELVYSVSSSDPALATVSLTGGDNLVRALAAGATGTATITVRAASVFDATDFVEASCTVTVVPPAAAKVGVAARELLISPSNGVALVDGRGDLAIRDQASGAWWLLASTGTGFVGAGFGSWPTTAPWASARGLRA